MSKPAYRAPGEHHATRRGDRERAANLAAALNDGPANLVGWWDHEPDTRARLVLTRSGPRFVPGRYARLDAMQFEVGILRAARAVGETIGGVLRALAPTYRRGDPKNYERDDYALAE
jgi:hypothetical protein